MIVSVHIPKTGGTLIGLLFDLASRRRIFYDYEGELAPRPRYFDEAQRFFRSYFMVVHGHFYLAKYFGYFDPAFYVTAMRHPVERVISQFNHILADPQADDRHRSDIQSGKMGPVDFAEDPNIGNAQSRYLGQGGLAKVDFVFLTEQLGESIRQFNARHSSLFGGQLLDLASAKTLRINAASGRGGPSCSPTQREREAIFARTRDDNALYAEALEKFRRQQ
jgi:hypothetical protein